METFDIILDENGFIAVDGDFKKGDNANNLIYYLVQANKGEYKEFPEVGVGIDKYLNTTVNPQQIESDILKVLTSDVFSDPDVDMSDYPSTININKNKIELS